MAILNYTTKIDAGKTVAELQQLLGKAGCQKVLIDYDDSREPVAVTFMVPVNGKPMFFTLPANPGGVLTALKRDRVPATYCNLAQARRVAWRIIKVWCEAQLAIIDAGQAQLAEVFLPYAQTANGQTLFKAIETGSLKLLN
jgi:hypothetical protein